MCASDLAVVCVRNERISRKNGGTLRHIHKPVLNTKNSIISVNHAEAYTSNKPKNSKISVQNAPNFTT